MNHAWDWLKWMKDRSKIQYNISNSNYSTIVHIQLPLPSVVWPVAYWAGEHMYRWATCETHTVKIVFPKTVYKHYILIVKMTYKSLYKWLINLASQMGKRIMQIATASRQHSRRFNSHRSMGGSRLAGNYSTQWYPETALPGGDEHSSFLQRWIYHSLGPLYHSGQIKSDKDLAGRQPYTPKDPHPKVPQTEKNPTMTDAKGTLPGTVNVESKLRPMRVILPAKSLANISHSVSMCSFQSIRGAWWRRCNTMWTNSVG